VPGPAVRFYKLYSFLMKYGSNAPSRKKKVSTQGNFIGRVTNYLSDASADFKINVCQTPQTLQEN
jgi:hypothetical protein